MDEGPSIELVLLLEGPRSWRAWVTRGEGGACISTSGALIHTTTNGSWYLCLRPFSFCQACILLIAIVTINEFNHQANNDSRSAFKQYRFLFFFGGCRIIFLLLHRLPSPQPTPISCSIQYSTYSIGTYILQLHVSRSSTRSAQLTPAPSPSPSLTQLS